MDIKDILDKTNPQSKNAAAGALTTREMLRELMARGIVFDNLSIVIRRSISTDEI